MITNPLNQYPHKTNFTTKLFLGTMLIAKRNDDDSVQLKK